MGDCGEQAEKDLIENGKNLSSDVLKTGHHGSRYSSSKLFLDNVNMKYSVIMCGAGNSYGHPQAQALERLKEKDAEIIRTDLSGNVIFFSDGNTLSYTTDR